MVYVCTPPYSRNNGKATWHHIDAWGCYLPLSAVPSQPCYQPVPWGSHLGPSLSGSGCGISGPHGSCWEERVSSYSVNNQRFGFTGKNTVHVQETETITTNQIFPKPMLTQSLNRSPSVSHVWVCLHVHRNYKSHYCLKTPTPLTQEKILPMPTQYCQCQLKTVPYRWIFV